MVGALSPKSAPRKKRLYKGSGPGRGRFRGGYREIFFLLRRGPAAAAARGAAAKSAGVKNAKGDFRSEIH